MQTHTYTVAEARRRLRQSGVTDAERRWLLMLVDAVEETGRAQHGPHPHEPNVKVMVWPDHHRSNLMARLAANEAARLAAGTACGKHPAFDADNCPSCGTSERIGR